MPSPSAELRAALTGYAPLFAYVGDRVRMSAAQASDALPYVVYRLDRKQERGIDGALHGEIITAEIQAWAQSPALADQIADAIQDAITANLPDAMTTDRTTGLDPETLLDYGSVRAVILR